MGKNLSELCKTLPDRWQSNERGAVFPFAPFLKPLATCSVPTAREELALLSFRGHLAGLGGRP
jgi:hypothetical protein